MQVELQVVVRSAMSDHCISVLQNLRDALCKMKMHIGGSATKLFSVTVHESSGTKK